MMAPKYIDGGPFMDLAGAIAEKTHAALGRADIDAGLWVYADGHYEIASEPAPSRELVSFAPACIYELAEDLRSRLFINARRCAACATTIAEHSEFFRLRQSGACASYDAGMTPAKRAAA